MTSKRRAITTVAGAITIATIAACLSAPVLAGGLVGGYVGGSVGQSRLEAGTAGLLSSAGAEMGDFDSTHTAYQLVIGTRPVGAPLALELAYFDLGESKLPAYAGPGFLYGDVSQRGEGLFALFYLPVPIVEVYAKAGVSRIASHVNVTYCGVDNCQPASQNPTNDGLAVGAGLQWTLGRWALRGEYEHFNAGGGHPSLLSVGVTWTFL